ncbi:hypothetical protein MO867_21900 [Microbulbifer sp. OS29]|uniref:Ribosomal protein L7/L12 C-terminal domain-containing protein n=1 Tax=Microbulbifer okhotskensis TaxID=2926617 RepID=A0A9X2ERB8_9GAMM|nr:hypothetical protein [Microbulbifer okhotskensis]MCO1336982.1 hypothetical protein [Microbulbifer okhotskensis]
MVEEIEGKRIVSAIKLLREHRDIGLSEAKGIIDAYINEHSLEPTPSKMPGQTVLIGILALLCVLGYFFFGMGVG